MKTKILKFGMPLMAFLLAIVFAFASNSKSAADDLAAINGYILQNGICEEVTTCNNLGGVPCMFNGVVVRAKINQTHCGLQLYNWSN